MAAKTKLKIITPNGIFFNDEVEIVTLRTTEGDMGVLPGRMPLIAALAISNLYIGPISSNKHCAIAGGILYVTPSYIQIITDAIEYKEKIDLVRAERAKREAEAKLKTKLDIAEEMRTKLALERAINRIHVKKDF